MSIKDTLISTKTKWAEGEGPDIDVVISSRIRLARNLKDYPFPHFMSEEQADQILNAVRNVVIQNEAAGKLDYPEFILLSELTAIERQILVEKHLISPQHIQNPANRAVVLAADESVSIMVNEEDHLRIQCLLPGLQLEEAWNLANGTDDILEKQLDYSYCEKRGYLTSCPTNVGTGLRASVMLHLPCMVMTKQVGKIVAAVAQLGLAVRGYYGEGTEAYGNIFQVSNQVTMGYVEEEIVKNLLTVTTQVAAQERATREKIYNNNKSVIEDRIFRSFGIMSQARVMTSQEALKNISNLRLGVELGLLKDLNFAKINELIIITTPAFLIKKAGKDLNAEERDLLRAEIIREKIN
ncbi:protein arginine kinase [Phosphitispora sp. TUW77]|uniref:protein arginine kinase n=1 Tax=Phosphitispora sp. TUW77 TaxID=3152361 RepID=UPI003AB33665